jgi:hypothetical protein
VTVLLAAKAARREVDTDIRRLHSRAVWPDEEAITHSLNDYLWGKCEIEQAAQDVGHFRTPIRAVSSVYPASRPADRGAA